MNVINGKLRRAGANAVVETQDGIRWPVPREPAAGEGLDVSYGVRPEHLAVVQCGSAGSVPGEVVVVEPTGPETELLVRSGTEFGNIHGADERKVVGAFPDRMKALSVDAVIAGMAC